MASAPSSDACQYCKGRPASTERTYLDLTPLCLHELPPHGEINQYKGDQGPTLVHFLTSVLTEASCVDLDDETWSIHGKFDGPVQVEQRVKGEGSSAFLARRSYHREDDVRYEELDAVLARDHCRKEADYDPSVFDGNVLLRWSEEELLSDVQQLKPDWKASNVQMSSEWGLHHVLQYLVSRVSYTPDYTHDEFARELCAESASNIDSLRDAKAVGREILQHLVPLAPAVTNKSQFTRCSTRCLKF